MRRRIVLLLGALASLPLVCCAQQQQQSLPDAPNPAARGHAGAGYTAPTQGERFKTYVRGTFGVMSLLEAGAHAGIAQARGAPKGWPEDAAGYGDRFGSAYGEIIVRGTTEYIVADLFREDLRRARCPHPCSESVFRLAFEDAFLARKGSDGHEAISVARIVGPFSGGVVASNVWFPSGSGRNNIPKEAGLQFGLIYIRNVVRETLFHR